MQNQEQSNEAQKPNGLLGMLKGKNSNPLGGNKPVNLLAGLGGGGGGGGIDFQAQLKKKLQEKLKRMHER